jgi:hypothetical protein
LTLSLGSLNVPFVSLGLRGGTLGPLDIDLDLGLPQCPLPHGVHHSVRPICMVSTSDGPERRKQLIYSNDSARPERTPLNHMRSLTGRCPSIRRDRGRIPFEPRTGIYPLWGIWSHYTPRQMLLGY